MSVNGTTAVTLDDDTVIVDLRPETRRIFLEPGTGLLGANRAERIFKRAIDLLGAVVALVALSPVMLIAAIAVKLSSPGPVLYICDRVGEGGRHFRFMKFRTMVCDADERRKDLADANRHAGSPIFKVVDDPRVTTVGAALRRWSIDEMPQLFHVLSGKMSLVGPRPPLPDEVSRYTDYERQRLTVRPGLTCIWQVNGRSDLDFETWMQMDIDYIRTWSLGLDLRLLAKTIPAMLSRRGAY